MKPYATTNSYNNNHNVKEIPLNETQISFSDSNPK